MLPGTPILIASMVLAALAGIFAERWRATRARRMRRLRRTDPASLYRRSILRFRRTSGDRLADAEAPPESL